MRTCSGQGGLPLDKHVEGDELGHVQQQELASALCLTRPPQSYRYKLSLRALGAAGICIC